MLAYLAIEKAQEEELFRKELERAQNEGNAANDEDDKKTSMNHKLIEKVVRVFKTHRSVADIDCSFVKDVVDGMVKSETPEIDDD